MGNDEQSVKNGTNLEFFEAETCAHLLGEIFVS